MRAIILGTSGLDLMARPLQEAFSRLCGLSVEVAVGGYGQWQQNLLSATSDLSEPPPDMVLVVLDGEDLFGRYLEELPTSTPIAMENASNSRMEETLETLNRGLVNFPASQFVVTTVGYPSGTMLGSLEDNSYAAMHEMVDDFNRGLRRWARSSRRAHVVDALGLLLTYGSRQMRDGRFWALARCRWSREGLSLLARRVASLWNAINGNIRKCLVLDLDNTLWGGVAGEEEVSGLQIGHEGIGLAYREFQTRLKRLRSLGALLAIASKNDESLVWPIIDNHPDMVLRRSDFVAWRINWDDKAKNLQEIAAELNIGLDSLVFVDDNPAERERVRRALPEVAVPECPTEVTCLPEFAEELVWDYFNRITLSDEDLRKTEQYQARAKQLELEGKSQSVEEFLRSLKMHARLLLPDPTIQPRLAQMTQKTNQFNTTTRRYTEAEMARLAAAEDWLILASDLSDHFGDHGIVALAMVQRVSAQQWQINNFLMSCRVVGRTLEQLLLWGVAQAVWERGGTCLLAEYIPTKKNDMVRQLWGDLGFTLLQQDDDGRSVCSLDLRSKMAEPSPYIEVKLPGLTP